MSRFLTKLDIEELGDDRWQLRRDLKYQSDLLGALIIVPRGFETDLESVPRWLPLAYAVLYGSAHAAAVVHDWLYTTGIRDRKTSDAVLYEAIIASGHLRWKAWAIWLGVRLGGWMAWNAHRRVEQGT